MSKLLEAVEAIEHEIAHPKSYMGQRIRQHLAVIRAEAEPDILRCPTCGSSTHDSAAGDVCPPDPIARAKALRQGGYTVSVEDVDALVAEAERLRDVDAKRKAIFDDRNAQVERLTVAIHTLVADEVISQGKARELCEMKADEQRDWFRAYIDRTSSDRIRALEAGEVYVQMHGRIVALEAENAELRRNLEQIVEEGDEHSAGIARAALAPDPRRAIPEEIMEIVDAVLRLPLKKLR